MFQSHIVAGHSIRGALASGHDRLVAVLRIRVGPRHLPLYCGKLR
jgi:hypothetical protein